MPTDLVSKTGNPLIARSTLSSPGAGFYSFSREQNTLSWGDGPPSGAATCLWYVDVTATDPNACLYCGASGTWTAIATAPFGYFVPSGSSATTVQTALNSFGTVILGPGTHIWTTQVSVADDKTLIGCGNSTIVRWNAAGNYALLVSGPNGVGVQIGGFQLRSANDSLFRGGGIQINKVGGNSRIFNLFINRPKEHGIYFPAACTGESLVLDNVKVTEAVKDGINAVQTGNINLLQLQHCQLSMNMEYGLNLNPAGIGRFESLGMLHVVVQGNGRGRIGNGTFTAGTFTDEEVATQATTGATARIIGTQSAGTYLKAALISGTPNGTNVWTGGTSGATFTPTSMGGHPSDISFKGYVEGTLRECWCEPYAIGSEKKFTKAALRLDTNGTGSCGSIRIFRCTMNGYYPWTTDQCAAILAVSVGRPLIIDDLDCYPYNNATPNSGATVRYKLGTGMYIPIGARRSIHAVINDDFTAETPITYRTDWIIQDATIT